MLVNTQTVVGSTELANNEEGNKQVQLTQKAT
jgi:hypothetical protein